MESSKNNNILNNNNIIFNEVTEEISIKVKTIDSNEYMVFTNKDSQISELKKKIEEISKVPVDRQRLIFRGKQLKDTDTVNTYKISNLDVIHLVAKTTFESQTENTTETDNLHGESDRHISRSISSLLNFGRSGPRGIFDSINIGDPPIISNSSRRRRNVREDYSEYNSIECREAIKQNFSSLQNMFECKNVEIDQKRLMSLKEDEKIESFQFSKRRLSVGQWVDVKDTIDQWLEAQVIEIKDNKVYIHYNGWGTRWDEWISMDSDRIMPFRYYTKQTSIYNYNSPFPNVKPDANVSVYNHNDSNNHQFFDFFHELNNSYNYCRDIFEKINTNREFLRKYRSNSNNSDDNNAINIQKSKEKTKKDLMDISDENLNEIEIKNENDNLIIIPDITDNISIEINRDEMLKENKIKQREIFIYSKQVSPLLDRLGRIMTDMGLYLYHNMKNYKLEDLDKELFSSENIDEFLRKKENINNFTNVENSAQNRLTNLNDLAIESSNGQQRNTVAESRENVRNDTQKTDNENKINNLNENKDIPNNSQENTNNMNNFLTFSSTNNNINSNSRNSRTTNNQNNTNLNSILSNSRRNNNIQNSSLIEKILINQIPCIDTPYVISNNRQNNSQPLVDVYVHTIIAPVSSERQNETGENSRNLLISSRRDNISRTNTINNNISINPTNNNLNNSTENNSQLDNKETNKSENNCGDKLDKTDKNTANSIENNQPSSTNQAINPTVNRSSELIGRSRVIPSDGSLSNTTWRMPFSSGTSSSPIFSFFDMFNRSSNVNSENNRNNINRPADNSENKDKLDDSINNNLNLNENAERNNTNFLRRKRNHNSIENENNINKTFEENTDIIENGQNVLRNNDFQENNTNINLNEDFRLSPLLDHGIDMIIEEYTEEEDIRSADESNNTEINNVQNNNNQ